MFQPNSLVFQLRGRYLHPLLQIWHCGKYDEPHPPVWEIWRWRVVVFWPVRFEFGHKMHEGW